MKTYFKLLFAATLCTAASLGQAQLIIFDEDFELGALPAAWSKTQNNGSNGWLFGNDLGSTYYVIPAHTSYAATNDDVIDRDSGDDRLNTPALNLTAYTLDDVFLTFEYLLPDQFGPTVGTVEWSTDGGANWNVLTTLAPATDQWATATLDISALTNNNNLVFSFRSNDNGNWAQGFALDDVQVLIPNSTDASLDSIDAPEFSLSGPLDLGGTITNRSADVINSFLVQYRINNGPIQSSLHSNLNLARPDSFDFVHTVPATMGAPGLHQVEMWIAEVNGAVDSNNSNDQLYDQVSVLSEIPEKHVVMEVFTGSWCGWCPDAFVRTDDLLNSYNHVIPVFVHNADAMVFAEGDALTNTYIYSFPGGAIDRFKFDSETNVGVNRDKWDDLVGKRLDAIVPVSVSITDYSFDILSREIEVTVEASFVGTTSGDFRINALVLENQVMGAGGGYDQANYLNGTAGHPYEGAGDPIVGFEHNYTLRAMLGDTWGTQGHIPPTVNAGLTYTKTYTYTLPPDYNESKVSLVGYVSHHDDDINDRAILNARQVNLIPYIFRDSFETGEALE